MSELDCKICFYPLDKNKFLPRVLNCGHTFCSPCISELIENSKICPTCRRPFTSESINDYPVNYIVLELKYSAKDLEKNKVKLIEKYKSKLQTVKGEFEELKPVVIKLKELFESSEKQLDKLIKSSDDEDNVSKDTLREIEKSLETVRMQIKLPGSAQLSSLTFKLQECKPDFDIIAEIRKGISDHKTLAAVSLVNGVKKFGRISLKDNFIFIHAFESNHELDEDEDDFITFSYVDLQSCLFEVNENKTIHGFLDLTYQTKSSGHRVIIEVLKSSMDLGCSFLKLCTGENGISYKGCSYSQKYKDNKTLGVKSSYNNHSSVEVDKIIQIKKFNVDGKFLRENSLFYKYLDSNIAFAGCDFDKYYLSFNEEGAIDIFQVKNNSSTSHTSHSSPLFGTCNQSGIPFTFMNASGNVISVNANSLYHVSNVVGQIIGDDKKFASTFQNATFGKVVDCGVAFPL